MLGRSPSSPTNFFHISVEAHPEVDRLRDHLGGPFVRRVMSIGMQHLRRGIPEHAFHLVAAVSPPTAAIRFEMFWVASRHATRQFLASARNPEV